MAKKKTTSRTSARKKTAPKTTTQQAKPQSDDQDAGSFDIDSAADALAAAREELRKAEARYHQLRERASEKVEEIRETTVGEMVDGALEVVRKYPGQSLLAAFACGFMFDRWLRRK